MSQPGGFASWYAHLHASVTTPIIPYTSVYIDMSPLDILNAGIAACVTSSNDCLNLYPISDETLIQCPGCRIRILFGFPTEPLHSEYESLEQIYYRLQHTKRLNTRSTLQQNYNQVHFDIICLWARSFLNRTLPYFHPLTSPLSSQSSNMITTNNDVHNNDQNELCSNCILSTDNRDTKHSFPSLSHAFQVMVTLSVRSAFSAYLFSQNFPPGSIVLLSAVTIPDMAKVIRAHNLIPLPIDLDPNTTLIDFDKLQATVDYYGVYSHSSSPSSPSSLSSSLPPQTIDNGATPRRPKICLAILAYIFGIHNDLTPTIRYLHSHNIPVLEDCAEAYTSTSFSGHPEADLSLFSFGSIKNSTSFGGGIARVRDWKTYCAMLYIQRGWPRLRNQTYFKKVLHNVPVALMLNNPTIALTLYRMALLCHIDAKEWAISLLRGFPGDMVLGIRQSPALALVYVLRHRIATESSARLCVHAQKGALFEQALIQQHAHVDPVGRYALARGYWLFPFLVKSPQEVVHLVEKEGLQVYLGATQLKCLPIPSELEQLSSQQQEQISQQQQQPEKQQQPEQQQEQQHSITFPLDVTNASNIMNHVIYLPINRHVPDSMVVKMATILTTACGTRPSPISYTPRRSPGDFNSIRDITINPSQNNTTLDHNQDDIPGILNYPRPNNAITQANKQKYIQQLLPPNARL